MKMKIARSLAMVLITGMLFTACQGGGGSTPEGSTNVSTASAASEAAGDSSGSQGAGDSEFGANPSGKIVEWSQGESILKIYVEDVPKHFPNLEFEYVAVNNGDYITKLQTAVASKLDVPDILAGELSFRGQLFAMDISENLEAAPYNFDRSELLDAVVPGLLNSKGELIALDNQYCPSGFSYRRDLVKQYFGVEEPDEVYELVKDWPTFIETGRKLKELTNGEVNMMQGMHDLIDVLQGQTAMEYIDGDTIDITGRYLKAFEKACEIRDAGVPLASNEKSSTSWNAAVTNGTVLFFNHATWSTNYMIVSNDPEEKTMGQWGFTLCPEQTWQNGGTSVGIYKDSQNKEGAWAFLKHFKTTNSGYQSAYDGLGWMGSYKAFYEGADSPLNTGFKFEAWFNGQNYGRYLYDHVGTNIAPSLVPNPYHVSVNNALRDVSIEFMMNPNMTAQDGIDSMIGILKLQEPTAEIK